MRALLQRVSGARLSVDGKLVSETGEGLAVFACAMKGDTESEAKAMADKIAKLRILADEDGRMNRSLLDTGGQCLLVSQFTLAADTRKGRRPSYTDAMGPDEANKLVDLLGDELKALGVEMRKGVFGADMQIELSCDGPVTIWLSV